MKTNPTKLVGITFSIIEHVEGKYENNPVYDYCRDPCIHLRLKTKLRYKTKINFGFISWTWHFISVLPSQFPETLFCSIKLTWHIAWLWQIVSCTQRFAHNHDNWIYLNDRPGENNAIMGCFKVRVYLLILIYFIIKASALTSIELTDLSLSEL